MKQISSMDIFFLVPELKRLEGERIDNFYHENSTFYIRVYKRGEGRLYLTNILGNCVFMGKEKEESSYPSSFVLHLRKFLCGGFIKEIDQVDAERIIRIKIDKKNSMGEVESNLLFIELFSPGNVALTDIEGYIRHAAQRKKFKDRSIMVGDTYNLPPSKRLTFLNAEDTELLKEGLVEDKTIVKALATTLGLGGKYAEEVCSRAQIDKNSKATQVSQEEIEKIANTIEEIKNSSINACNLKSEKEVKDFFPFKFQSIEEELIEVENFNAAVKNYFEQFKVEEDKKEKELNQELNRLKNRLEKQQTQKEQILTEYEKLNSAGEKIYQNYQLVDELLKNINKAAKEKGWEHVKKTVEEDERLSKLIKKIDEKNNRIILNLD